MTQRVTLVEINISRKRCLWSQMSEEREVVVSIPNRLAPLIEDLHGSDPDAEHGARTFRLDHIRAQHPLRPSQTREENASYCSGSIMRIADILPAWTPVSGANRTV